MGRTNVDASSRTLAEEQTEAPSDEHELLAAALAATLVDYRRYIRQRGDSSGSSSVGNNWRMMACWERLRGRT
jgi:hypothetical protein